jgi:hypothetical protein
MVHILVAPDEYQKWSCEDEGVGWTDGPLEGVVGLSNVSRNQDREFFAHRA